MSTHKQSRFPSHSLSLWSSVTPSIHKCLSHTHWYSTCKNAPPETLKSLNIDQGHALPCYTVQRWCAGYHCRSLHHPSNLMHLSSSALVANVAFFSLYAAEIDRQKSCTCTSVQMQDCAFVYLFIYFSFPFETLSGTFCLSCVDWFCQKSAFKTDKEYRSSCGCVVIKLSFKRTH